MLQLWICTQYSVPSVASWAEAGKGRDKVQRPEYTTCKVKDRKIWLVHRRSYGCLKAFSLRALNRSGEREKPRGRRHWNSMTPECMYKFCSCFSFPNCLCPLLHQCLLPMPWIKVRLYFVWPMQLMPLSGLGKAFLFTSRLRELAGGEERKKN